MGAVSERLLPASALDLMSIMDVTSVLATRQRLDPEPNRPTNERDNVRGLGFTSIGAMFKYNEGARNK